MSGPQPEWPPKRVASFVENVGPSDAWKEAGRLMETNKIDGITLLNMEVDDMIELGMSKIHARTLRKLIANDQGSNNNDNNSNNSRNRSNSSSSSSSSNVDDKDSEKPPPYYISKDKPIQLYIWPVGRPALTVEVTLDDKIEDVKMKIQQQLGMPCAQQRLIFVGRRMENDRTLAQCGIKHEDSLHLVKQLEEEEEEEMEEGMQVLKKFYNKYGGEINSEERGEPVTTASKLKTFSKPIPSAVKNTTAAPVTVKSTAAVVTATKPVAAAAKSIAAAKPVPATTAKPVPAAAIKTAVKPAATAAKSAVKPAATAVKPAATAKSLFAGDDDDDHFSTQPVSTAPKKPIAADKPITAVLKPKSAASLFDDEDDFFCGPKPKPSSGTSKPTITAKPVVTAPKRAASLFDDDDDFSY